MENRNYETPNKRSFAKGLARDLVIASSLIIGGMALTIKGIDCMEQVRDGKNTTLVREITPESRKYEISEREIPSDLRDVVVKARKYGISDWDIKLCINNGVDPISGLGDYFGKPYHNIPPK